MLLFFAFIHLTGDLYPSSALKTDGHRRNIDNASFNDTLFQQRYSCAAPREILLVGLRVHGSCSSKRHMGGA